MSFTWKDKVNEVDDILAEDINLLASGIKANEKAIQANGETISANVAALNTHKSDSAAHSEALAQERSISNRQYANAIRGTASGNGVIRVDDVSPLEHTVKVSGQLGTSLTVCGKNLFPPIPEHTAYGVTLSKKDDYYVLNGTCTQGYNFLSSSTVLPAGTYTLSAHNPVPFNASSTGDYSLRISSNNVTIWFAANSLDAYVTHTQKIEQTAVYQCIIKVTKGITYDNFIVKPQLELGDTATEYEPYAATTYTPDADGVVEIPSVSPSMTIFSDAAGVNIEAEYNRDTNAVIHEMANAIIALGGTL